MAWVIACASPQMTAGLPVKGNGWRCQLNDRPGTFICTGLPAVPPGAAVSEMVGGDIPFWSMFQRPPSDDARQSHVWTVEDARGWPMRSLRSSYLFDTMTKPAQSSKHSWGVVVWPTTKVARPGAPVAGRSQLPIVLPFQPLWIGFAINSLAYAIAWYVLLVAPRDLRSASRRRRGMCVQCGYDLRGSPNNRCPECGGAKWKTRSRGTKILVAF